MSRVVACLALLALLACGGPTQSPLPPLPPRFTDADPVDWGGPGPQAWPVHGVDLSRYQKRIDWEAARRSGVSFAYVKATEGGDRLDPIFNEVWHSAAEAGVARGAYHFFYFCTPAEVQARWFIANVPRDARALPPVLDLEWNHLSPTCRYRPPPEVVRAEAATFLRIVGQHYGRRPVVYTTPDFWTRNDVGRLGHEVWLRSTARHVETTYPGVDWRFWQYSATGRVPGVVGDIDLNVFRGSRADWARWSQQGAGR